MEIIRRDEVGSFANGGVTSEQLLFPENSRSQRVTITRVTVAPGAKNPPHAHAASEQVWSRCAVAASCCWGVPQLRHSRKAMLCALRRATSMALRTLVPSSSYIFR